METIDFQEEASLTEALYTRDISYITNKFKIKSLRGQQV